jgi:hypothetical protein
MWLKRLIDHARRRDHASEFSVTLHAVKRENIESFLLVHPGAMSALDLLQSDKGPFEVTEAALALLGSVPPDSDLAVLCVVN